MADEVDIECPGCGAVFGIPVELCGEMAQCAECDVIFEIPTLDEDEGDGEVSTDTGAIKGIEADGDATNTVRLSRTGIGMIPQIKDNFMSDFPVTSAPAPSKPAAPRPSAPPPPPQPPLPHHWFRLRRRHRERPMPLQRRESPRKRFLSPHGLNCV